MYNYNFIYILPLLATPQKSLYWLLLKFAVVGLCKLHGSFPKQPLLLCVPRSFIRPRNGWRTHHHEVWPDVCVYARTYIRSHRS